MLATPKHVNTRLDLCLICWYVQASGFAHNQEQFDAATAEVIAAVEQVRALVIKAGTAAAGGSGQGKFALAKLFTGPQDTKAAKKKIKVQQECFG